jgi:hypothetical protein
VPGYVSALSTVSNGGSGNGVRTARVFQRLLGVEQTTVESVELVVEDGEEVLVARVRPHAGQRSRCNRCRRRCPGIHEEVPEERPATERLRPEAI